MATERPPEGQAGGTLNNSRVGAISGGTFISVAGDLSMHRPQDRVNEVVRWLSAINFRSIQQENLRKHTVGTGVWLLSHQDFVDWKAGEKKVFWITGMPGSGKTVLCAATNNALQKEFKSEPGTLFLMVFCRYDNKLTAAQIAAGITCQIVSSTRDERVLSLIYAFHDQHVRDGTTPELQDFVELFEQVFPLYDRVVTSIDAFDETSDEVRQELLEAFTQLDVSLFITSRPSIDHFKALVTDVCPLRLESTSTRSGDIEHFIRTKLSKAPRLMAITKRRPEILEEACIKLIGKSKGMFLLAALHIASLQRATDSRHMMKLIDALPTELMTMYHHTWKRIKAQDRDSFDLARRTFLWILHSADPFYNSSDFSDFSRKGETLRQFLTISIAERSYSPDSAPPRELIQAVCEGLVDFDEQSLTVRLCHYTTKDFFESEAIHSQISPSPSAEIVASLITAITSWGPTRPFVDWWEYTRPDELDEKERAFFIPYAYELWPLHYALIISNERSLTWEMLGCTAPLQPCSQYQLRTLNPNNPKGAETLDIVGPAHLAAHYLALDLESIALEGANTRSSLGFLPIHYLLLENFTRHQHPISLDLLVSMLEKGVDVNAAADGGITPLMLAAFSRNESARSVLLSHPDCDVTRVDDRGRTALHWAPMTIRNNNYARRGWGRPNALPSDSLLIAACGVNNVDVDGRTPLWYITAFDFYSVKDDPIYGTTLNQMFWWPIIHHPDFDINLQDKEGVTPLMVVVGGSNNNFETLEALLAIPALDVNMQDFKNGETALHHVVCRPWRRGPWDPQKGGHRWRRWGYECLQRLLGHPDIDVSIKDYRGRSALDVVEDWVARGRWPGEFESVIDMLKSHPSACEK